MTPGLSSKNDVFTIVFQKATIIIALIIRINIAESFLPVLVIDCRNNYRLKFVALLLNNFS